MLRKTFAIIALFALLSAASDADAGKRRKKTVAPAAEAKEPDAELSLAVQEVMAKFRILGPHGKSAVDVLIVEGGNQKTVKSKNWAHMAASSLALYNATAIGAAYGVVRYGEEARTMFGEEVNPTTQKERYKELEKGFNEITEKLPKKTCDLGQALNETITMLTHRDPNAQHLVFFLTDCKNTPTADSPFVKGKEPWDLAKMAKIRLKHFRYRIKALGLSKNTDIGLVSKVFGENKVDTEVISAASITDRMAEDLAAAPAFFLKERADHEWQRGRLRLRRDTEDPKASVRISEGETGAIKFQLSNDLPHFDINARITKITAEPDWIEVLEAPLNKTIRIPSTRENNGLSEMLEVKLRNNSNIGGVFQTDQLEEVTLIAHTELAPILEAGFKELKIGFEVRKQEAREPFNLAFLSGLMPIWLPVSIVIAIILGIFIAGLVVRKPFPHGVAVEIYGPDDELIVDAELHEYDLGLFKRAGFVLGDQGDLVAGKDNYLEVIAEGARNPWRARPLQEKMTLNGQPFNNWSNLKVGDVIVSKLDRVTIKFTPVGEQ